MSLRRIIKSFIIVFCFVVFVGISISCNNERGMMHGNSSMGMDNWNWIQIIISLGIGLLIGLLIGFLFGSVVCKREK